MASKIEIKYAKPRGKGEGDKPMPDDDDDLGEKAKREALGRLARAMGVTIKDESAALDAFGELVYHCGDEG